MADQTIASPVSSEAPTSPAATLDPERQQQARRYATLRRWLSLADLALGGVALGLHLRLRDALTNLAAWQPAHGWSPLLIAAYSAIFVVGYTVAKTVRISALVAL